MTGKRAPINSENITVAIGAELKQFIEDLRDSRGSTSKAEEIRRCINLMKLLVEEVEKGNDIIVVDEAVPCPECRSHMKQILFI